MAEQPVQGLSDHGLIEAIRRIEPEIAWPVAAPIAGGADLARLVRGRIDKMPTTIGSEPVLGQLEGLWRRVSIWRPARRALLLAIGVLIALAALAGAAGLGLPGLRIFFGGGPASPPPSLEPSRSPSPGGPGAGLHLGDPITLPDDALDATAGFHVLRPTDPLTGPPDATYIDAGKGGQVSLVWASRSDLPDTLEPDVGLLLTEFRGTVDAAFFSKVAGSDTRVESVRVNGRAGFWLSGAPHFFFYSGPSGVVQDDRRWVGDALVWSDGAITYRLESALGREVTIRIAQSLR